MNLAETKQSLAESKDPGDLVSVTLGCNIVNRPKSSVFTWMREGELTRYGTGKDTKVSLAELRRVEAKKRRLPGMKKRKKEEDPAQLRFPQPPTTEAPPTPPLRPASTQPSSQEGWESALRTSARKIQKAIVDGHVAITSVCITAGDIEVRYEQKKHW